MAGISVGSVFVDVVPNMARFTSALGAEANTAAGRLSAGLSSAGAAATKYLTIPILAAGAASTKMALDFNEAFVHIQTLAGNTGLSISQMQEQVKSLAQQTGQDPTGLANALYQVASAGKVAASQAMPILTSAAKGAALGMGDVNDIATVLTSTMNAYGPKTISASQAMDTLTQATHDSAAEADALASSIGPVIGIGAQVGVSFQDIAAAIATATNQGISAERAATGLRFLLQSLSAPTQIAKDKLDQYGISVQDLGRMLSNEGLQGTLQSLADTFDLTSARGKQAWKDVVGGARGAIIANTQVGHSAKAAADEVKSLGDAAGVTQQKFKIWGETITGKNAKALADLKVAAIDLGEQLIPIFGHIVSAVSSVAKWFAALPDSTQAAIVKLAGVAALAGPFLRLAGAVVRVGIGLSSIAKVGSVGIGNILGVGSGTAGAVGGISSALLGGAGLVAGLLALKAVAPGASDALHTFIDTLGGLKRQGIDPGFLHDLLNFGTQHTGFDPTEITATGKAIQEQAAALAHGNFTGQEYINVLHDIGAESKTAAAAGLHPMHLELESLANGFKSGYLNSFQLAGGMKALGIAAFHSEDSFHAFANVMLNAQGATGKTITTTQRLINGIDKAGGSLSGFRIKDLALQLELGHTGKVIEFLRNKLQELRGSADGAGKGLDHTGDGAKGATKDIDGAGRVSRKTGQEFHKLGGASDAVAHGAKAVAGAVRSATSGFKGAGGAAKGAAGGFKSAGGAATDAQGKTQDLGRALEDVGRQHPRPTITVETGQAVSAVHSVLGLLQSVNGFVAHAVVSVSRQVTTSVSNNAIGGIVGLQSGGITQAPVFQFGEGSYPTPWGKGAELVQPLDRRGIGILGEAFDAADARRARRRGGDGGHLVLDARITIDNWDEGTGRMRGVARQELDDDHRYSAALARR